MTIKLKAEQMQQLWNENNPEAIDWLVLPEGSPREIVQTCPPQLGWGQRTWTQLDRGWTLLIHDYQLQEDLEIFSEPRECDITVEIGFQLSGETAHSEGGFRQAGEHFLAFDAPLEKTGSIIRSHKRRILQVDLHLNTLDALISFIREQPHDFPPQVREFMEAIAAFSSNPNDLISLLEVPKKKAEQCNYYIGRISRVMQTTLQQLLHCPYQGSLKTMYVESKVLELFMLYLAQLKDDIFLAFEGDRIAPHPKLQDDDINRIYRARDILRDCLDNPPSLLNLARQVGLNDYKLKLGFRHVFGTTAFGYLYQYRMERAGQMLQ
ncbi:MAG: AraC family transcriptional regulator, partial [Cyanobacteria bacterium P01_E01_bin.42]